MLGQPQEKTRRARDVFARGLRSLFRDARGNVAPLMALLLVPIIGSMALGGEVSSWFMSHRSLQNAADSAVLAAAQRGGANYDDEAIAVAKSYGLTPSSIITVSPTIVTCPAGAPVVGSFNCYQVQIDRLMPLYLVGVVGYPGDATMGSSPAKRIRAAAIAGTVASTRNYCLIGLNGIVLNGGGDTPDFSGCDFLSGADLTCNGQNIEDADIGYGDAAGSNGTNGGQNTCGGVAREGVPFDGDPYATQVADNIADLDLSGCAAQSGAVTLGGGTTCFDGVVTLTADVVVSNANTVLVIRDGGLNLAGHTLSTGPGGSLTIVYTGTEAPVAVLDSTPNGGTLDIAAPSAESGSVWAGMALVEDPNLTGVSVGAGAESLDIDFSGSEITLKVTGLFYLPNGNFNVTGAINHATYSDHGSMVGESCLGILADTITLSGTISLFAHPTEDCGSAGLDDLPTVPLVRLLG